MVGYSPVGLLGFGQEPQIEAGKRLLNYAVTDSIPADVLKGILDFVRMTGDTYAGLAQPTIDDVVKGALDVSLGGSVATKPAGALAAGGARTTRVAAPKTEQGMENLSRLSSRNLKDPSVVTDAIIGTPVTMQKTNPLTARRYVEPNFLSGGYGINFPGDRTRAGVSLLGMGDNVRFDIPVAQRGGFNFMRETPGSIWASGDSVIKSMANEVDRIRALDSEAPIYGLTQTMGPRAVDFSDQMANTLVERVKLGERLGDIGANDIAKFDNAMRTGEGLQLKPKPKGSDKPAERYKFPDWPGITDPNARDILSQNGQMRIQMAKLMEKQQYARKGFPDVAQTRAMITDPKLIDVTPDVPMFGYNIGRVDAENPIRQVVDMPHPAYPSQLSGDMLVALGNSSRFQPRFQHFTARDVWRGRILQKIESLARLEY